MKNIKIIIIGLLFFSCEADVDLLEELLNVPSKVNLEFPENNSECTTGTILSDTESEVVFRWEAAEIGDTYNISLTNLSSTEETTYSSNGNTLPVRLKRGMPYSWKVTTTLQGSSKFTVSDTSTFYNAGPGVLTYIPFPAVSISPSDKEQLPNNTTQVTLQWSATDLDNDISYYDVYLGVTNPPSLFNSELTANNIANINVTVGNTYYWKVDTVDQAGNKSQSNIFTFEILN